MKAKSRKLQKKMIETKLCKTRKKPRNRVKIENISRKKHKFKIKTAKFNQKNIENNET